MQIKNDGAAKEKVAAKAKGMYEKGVENPHSFIGVPRARKAKQKERARRKASQKGRARAKVLYPQRKKAGKAKDMERDAVKGEEKPLGAVGSQEVFGQGFLGPDPHCACR